MARPDLHRLVEVFFVVTALYLASLVFGWWALLLVPVAALWGFLSGGPNDE